THLPSEIHTLSLHDALPIFGTKDLGLHARNHARHGLLADLREGLFAEVEEGHIGAVTEQQKLEMVVPHPEVAFQGFLVDIEEIVDRKSTRLNSSHVKISYAV